MWVSQLRLRNFRSYEAFDLSLQPGVTTFVAPNGWGKTNLVEALAYLSHVKSHRVVQDLALVHSGHTEAIVAAQAHRGQRQVTLEITIRAKGANVARINRQNVRTSELLGLLPCVVFAPEDLGLVKGEPQQRRDFLDDLLVQTSPRFVAVRSDFERALKQRNALLRDLRISRAEDLESTLSIWNEAFAQAAAQLVVGRIRLLRDLTGPLHASFATLAHNAAQERQTVSARYSSRIDYAGIDPTDAAAEVDAKAAILSGLEDRLPGEIERGVTLAGPQRDDVDLLIGSTPAKGYASHGESWSLALALKLASWQVLQVDSAGPQDSPVLVLDDVFAELDEGRRDRLAQLVQQAEQVLITAAVASDVPAQLSSSIIKLDEL